MENEHVDKVTDEEMKQETQLEMVNLHLGTNLGAMLQYRPQPAVMDTV